MGRRLTLVHGPEGRVLDVLPAGGEEIAGVNGALERLRHPVRADYGLNR